MTLLYEANAHEYRFSYKSNIVDWEIQTETSNGKWERGVIPLDKHGFKSRILSTDSNEVSSPEQNNACSENTIIPL